MLPTNSVLTTSLLIFTLRVGNIALDIGLRQAAPWKPRLAIGFSHVRIVTSANTHQMSASLRKSGYGVTEYIGHGKDGRVLEVNVITKRRDLSDIEEIASRIDPKCFITSEAINPMRRGHWRVT